MLIFQKSVVNKYLKNLDEKQVNSAFEKFKKFYGDKERLQNIMQLKEENYQEGFLREIFVQTLGYTISPDKNYNITTEFKNQKDSRKADGAILKNGNAIGVIELKSTKTKNLESIKEQAFGYKNNQPNCKYVITSNFHSIRFYIDNATEYEEFNLFDLSKEQFKIFYLILHKDSILNHLPEKLKQETQFHEEQITEKLYKDYQAFKNRIFDNLVKRNPQYDKLTLFKKSQKLLDRFLFILFAEDTGLIPPNSIIKIIEQWKQLQELEKDDTLYSRFQLFFRHLDKGHTYKSWGEIPAYNGGLFTYDEILDNPKLTLPDGLLQNHTPILSAYDFNSEVDVNILGHIFEHSLSEIEELTAELQAETVDKTKSKKKKDGIFYTPKYITKYIVENTVGTLCDNRKKELGIDNLLIDNSLYLKNGKLNKNGKKLFETIQNYKNWLLTLKILDPACGSGAFLNQTLDFLITEHKQIDNLTAELTGDKTRLFDTDKQILENNIFGVDINEESVEIAKLSLWLRTAQRGRVLSDLSNNIKCGNSLIDDAEVAGKKAFNWELEFKEIMESGGFDVVLGNPPYVVLAPKYLQNYNFSKANNNTYVAFIEKSLCLLKQNGKLGFIVPNTWFSGDNFETTRNELLTNYDLHQIIQLPYDIFNAYVDTSIVIINNCTSSFNTLFYKYDIKDYQNVININKFILTKTDKWLKLNKIFLNNELMSLVDKVWFSDKNVLLGQISEINRGALPPKNNEKSEIQTEYYDIKWFEDQIFRYTIEKRSIYPSFVNYESLRENKNIIVYNSEKLIARQLMSRQFRMNVTYLNEPCAFKKNLYAIFNLENSFSYLYLLAILNSKLFSFTQVNFNTSLQRDDFPAFSLNDFKNFPIAASSKQIQKPLIEKSNLMLALNKELQIKKHNFINTLKEEKHLKKISKRLENFNELDFKTFKKEIGKQKARFSLGKETNEWREYFNTSKQKINELQSKIIQTDAEIDRMVYELYELTPQEIEIIENTMK